MSLSKKVGHVFVIIGLAAICELLTTIVLGRNLMPSLFGKFKFIHTIVLMLSSIFIFGQNTTIIRLMSKEDYKQYDWKKFIKTCLMVSSAFGVIAILIIGVFYDLQKELIVIGLAVLAAMSVEFFSSILRSRLQYQKAIIISKAFSVIFFLTVAVLIYVVKTQDLGPILIGYAAVYLLAVLFGLNWLKSFSCGQKPFPQKVIKQGILLFLITVSFTIMVQIDQFFIAKMLDYERLGGYTAVIAVTRGFDLLAMALWFVLMPQYSKQSTRPIGRDVLKVLTAGIMLVLVYVFVSKFLLDILFDGKFNYAEFLFKFFIAIGFLRIIYTIPSGIIAGRLSSNFLKVFLACCFLGIVINILGNLLLIPRWGLSGAACATLISWLFRVIAAYIIIFIGHRNGLTAKSA
jgi:O-antigen/teichoic acid export membrane protein